MAKRIPEDKKIKKESFVLSFNEEKSSFKPIIEDVKNDWTEWLTSKTRIIKT